MKKTLLIMTAIVLSLSIIKANEVEACGSDGECYAKHLQTEEATGKTFTNYYYSGKTYKIRVPNTRQHFIRLEYLFNVGKLTEGNEYFRAVKLNGLLVKSGLEPLYY